MTNNSDFYTKTMAKVYADQGYFEKAAEIYRYLLKQEPERHDLFEALAEVEIKLSEKAPDKLVLLFGEWFDLAVKYNNLQKLKKIRNALHKVTKVNESLRSIFYKTDRIH
ncbi:MAG: hypothetical protein JRD93_13685 [Deltaproteobacteria bacterium]|nr:hypothetical protein [Deltaproteobacteria bacterium]MBW2663008.1 hypothetical protein [Deltaproteobacteria bacterium]